MLVASGIAFPRRHFALVKYFPSRWNYKRPPSAKTGGHIGDTALCTQNNLKDKCEDALRRLTKLFQEGNMVATLKGIRDVLPLVKSNFSDMQVSVLCLMIGKSKGRRVKLDDEIIHDLTSILRSRPVEATTVGLSASVSILMACPTPHSNAVVKLVNVLSHKLSVSRPLDMIALGRCTMALQSSSAEYD
jgi:hypothetical protein